MTICSCFLPDLQDFHPTFRRQTGRAITIKRLSLKKCCLLVDDAERVLTDKTTDLDDFGRLLDHTWKLKRQSGAAISTDSIDALYSKGIAAGALGGKLLGAGGGGFLCVLRPARVP